MFIGRADVEAETLILWPLDEKSWLIWKDPDAEKDWSQEETGVTEDEIFGCHHQLNGHEFESTLGFGDELGGLVCCSPWSRKEPDMTEQQNWTDLLSMRFCVRNGIQGVNKLVMVSDLKKSISGHLYVYLRMVTVMFLEKWIY